MVRISGVTLPNKRMQVALTYIYGIGQTKSKQILEEAKVDMNKRPKELSEEDVNAIRNIISKKFTVEGDLRRKVIVDIRRLKDIKSYRGTRHAKHLPVRGQRTKVNSRSVRGNTRKTMGSGRVKAQKT